MLIGFMEAVRIVYTNNPDAPITMVIASSWCYSILNRMHALIVFLTFFKAQNCIIINTVVIQYMSLLIDR